MCLTTALDYKKQESERWLGSLSEESKQYLRCLLSVMNPQAEEESKHAISALFAEVHVPQAENVNKKRER